MELASDAHYYTHAIATLVQGFDVKGVYSVGPLTAQHLIHIAVLCGCLVPAGFICHRDWCEYCLVRLPSAGGGYGGSPQGHSAVVHLPVL